MIELELYAAGVRNTENVLKLGHEFEAVPGLRYKVDVNHDIVYLEFTEPVLSVEQILSIFSKLDLTAKIVGTIPPELRPKTKTQRISGT